MDWQLKFTGWPWWVVLPAALLGVWLLVRLHRHELSTVAPRLRRQLLILRSAALALLILFFLEPSLTRVSSERVLPAVAILVDQSGSMALKDEQMPAGVRLGEAIGLGILPANVRPLKTNVEEQAASDQAIARAPAMSNSLAQLSTMSRFDRGAHFVREKALPLLKGRARVRIFGMDTGVAPLDLAKPPRLVANRATAFDSALAGLARAWPQEYIGGILLVSDGRQTAGADPVPVIRSFRARGANLAGVAVGDPGTPPDAVVAGITGGNEVFLGENVPLSVRYRITGSREIAWDLVISHAGTDLERRTVYGNGLWQYETFAFAATNAGLQLYQARLEMAHDQQAAWLSGSAGQIQLELWKNVNGMSVAELVQSNPFKTRTPAIQEIGQLDYSSRGQQYGARVRGLLLPPQTGNYIFYITSDDSSELWVSASEKPEDKARIAWVNGYSPRDKWDAQPNQRSSPVTLQAGRPHYFEILHKQGGGEDHLVVGWQLPDGTLERPIPGSRLAGADEKTLERLTRHRQAGADEKSQWKEATLANNRADFSVSVSEDPIKVLLVDSTPRWESRYLAAMFERDRRVHFTRRYHSIIIDDPNLRLLPKDQAEWDAYDMVCLGDLDSTELPPDQQKFLNSFVARRGGFLVCVAGPRGLPRAFSLGTLANLLPVRVSLQGNRDPEPVSVSLTPAGTEHPITQILNDPELNTRMWPMLPQLQWLVDGVVPKPGAEVLLAADNPARTPIVALQRYGAGRILWMGTEESWRWRDRLGERVHQTFWLQVMRWGLAGRLRGKNPGLQVGLDRSLLAPGESAELRVRTADASGNALSDPPIVRLERLDQTAAAAKTEEMAMTPLPEAAGIFHLELAGLAPGDWRATVTHRALPGVQEVRELSVRDQNGLEGIELGADLAGLSRLAAAGGHGAVPLADADALLREFAERLKPRDMERRQTLRLWNSYFSLLLVVGALTVEWALRKRNGLP